MRLCAQQKRRPNDLLNTQFRDKQDRKLPLIAKELYDAERTRAAHFVAWTSEPRSTLICAAKDCSQFMYLLPPPRATLCHTTAEMIRNNQLHKAKCSSFVFFPFGSFCGQGVWCIVVSGECMVRDIEGWCGH